MGNAIAVRADVNVDCEDIAAVAVATGTEDDSGFRREERAVDDEVVVVVDCVEDKTRFLIRRNRIRYIGNSIDVCTGR